MHREFKLVWQKKLCKSQTYTHTDTHTHTHDEYCFYCQRDRKTRNKRVFFLSRMVYQSTVQKDPTDICVSVTVFANPDTFDWRDAFISVSVVRLCLTPRGFSSCAFDIFSLKYKFRIPNGISSREINYSSYTCIRMYRGVHTFRGIYRSGVFVQRYCVFTRILIVYREFTAITRDR